MRAGLLWVGLATAFFLAEPYARADEPPVVVEPPLPDLPQKPAEPIEPSPVKIEMPPGPTPTTRPAPPTAATQAPAPPPPLVAPKPEERKTITELGLGPTYFGAIQKHTTHSEAGVVFQVAPRFPIGDHYGIGLRFAFGMTGWDRTVDVARPGYKIGRWTTHAYSDVWDWAGEGEKDTRGLRFIGAFFAFIGLIVPYVFAGMFYIAAPFAASSYGEADLTFHWEPGDDPKQGPYLKGGLALAAYVHPDSGHLFGGLGPNVGFGYRAGSVSLGLVGTFLPYGLHGNDTAEHIFIGSLTIGVVH